MTVLKLRQTTAGLRCSSCGAAAKASCNCGAAYIPAGVLAAQALAKNPTKSDSALAAAIGVGKATVARARKSTGPYGPVGKRIGKDGKARKLPKRPAPKISDPVKEVNTFHKELVSFLNTFTEKFHKWHDAEPVITDDGKATLMQALYLCADGFAQLAQKLDGR
jgi:hypothetical protein